LSPRTNAPPAAETQFTYAKKRTIAAWHRMQEIDRLAAMMTDPVQQHANVASQYAQIDFENVAPLLVEHLRESIAIHQRGRDLAARYLAEVDKQRIDNAGAQRVVGQLSGLAETPQQAAAANFLGGTFTAAAAEEAQQKIIAKYKPEWDAQFEAERISTSRDKDLAELLSKKYGVPFIDGM